MLCKECSSITFVRPTKLSVHYSEKDAIYKHHESQQALKASKDTCPLCAKLWFAFQTGEERFENSEPAPIILSIYFEYSWLYNWNMWRNLDGEILSVRCGYAEIFTSLIPTRLFDAELKNILEGKASVSSPRFPIWRDRDDALSDNMELAKYWLKRCSELHVPCQPCTQPAELPLRVLQVIARDSVRLIEGTGVTAVYACLSYKWGDAKRFLLDDSTICGLEKGMFTYDLPLTFKEAVRLTYELGLQYLWIDALCIKQDSSKEKDEQIGSMDAIYQGAALTVFAAASDDANSGLGTVKSAALVRQTKVTLKLAFGGSVWSKGFFIGEFLRHGYDRPHGKLPLFKRGWVLQEEVLSRRGLVFESEGIHWSCNSDECSENYPTIGPVGTDNRNRLSAHSSFRAWLSGRNPASTEKRWPRTHERLDVLDLWYKLVENYFQRDLTEYSDILPALSGLASAVHTVRGKRYLAGLWESDIQLGLLWRMHHPHQYSDGSGQYDFDSYYTSARNSALTYSTDSVDDVVQEPTPISNRVSTLPSWSWISGFGDGAHIVFEHKRRYVRDEAYGLQMLDYKVRQPENYNNMYGQVLSAVLTIRACVKWATVVAPPHERNSASKSGWIWSDSLTKTTTSDTEVAIFWPDDPYTAYNKYGSLHVLCVLCAVASAQLDHTNKGNTKITAICVVPMENSSQRQYRRVGLAIFSFEHSDWFGSEQYNLEKEEFYWEPGPGAFMDTLELV